MSNRSSKGVTREFQGSLKTALRKLQGCLKKMLSVCQENFKKKLQGCFMNVLSKFHFPILLLQGSHRSYPSRRRACYFRN